MKQIQLYFLVKKNFNLNIEMLILAYDFSIDTMLVICFTRDANGDLLVLSSEFIPGGSHLSLLQLWF